MKKRYSGAQEMSGTMTETHYTYLIKKATLFFIILMGISPLLTFASASALEFNFSSPLEVEMNKSFQVSISAETSLIWDVKVFINDSTIKAKDYAEILVGEEWENPFYYLRGVFPPTAEFTIRALKLGDFNICARLRNSSTSTSCNNITIIENSSPPPEPEPENDTPIANTTQNNTSDDEEAPQENTLPSNTSPITSSLINTNLQNAGDNAKDNEIIYLNKKPSANSEVKSSDIFISKDEKIRLWTAYGFAGLCILILIFVLLRKL